jgi:hypothetical protein
MVSLLQNICTQRREIRPPIRTVLGQLESMRAEVEQTLATKLPNGIGGESSA